MKNKRKRVSPLGYNCFGPNKNPKRRDTLMDFILPLLENLGRCFVEIGGDFLDHPERMDEMERAA